jgi:hypothetical protein
LPKAFGFSRVFVIHAPDDFASFLRYPFVRFSGEEAGRDAADSANASGTRPIGTHLQDDH